MRRLLIAFDTWLITHVFEPVSWWFEATLEIDCFSLARYSVTIHLATQSMLQLHHSGLVMGVMDLAFNTFIWFMAWGACRDIERRVKRSSPCINHLKVDWPLRLLGVAVIAVVIVAGPTHTKLLPAERMLDVVSHSFLFGYLYFASCNPMPPGWKLRRRKYVWAPA